MDAPRRWTLPDLPAALQWARQRSGQGIRCTLALLGEYARTPEEALAGTRENLGCIPGIGSLGAGASLSVKLGGIGGIFDTGMALDHAVQIARVAGRNGVPVELDMEGRATVGLTLDAASRCAKENPAVTVALQSYLARTPGDIRRMVSEGIGVRLIKGAYLGDTTDFARILQLTMEDARILGSLGARFSLGTHDPGLIAWAEQEFRGRKDGIEFGFLLGLSDETKLRLVAGGWRVSEYVPFGQGGEAYVLRRERYLRDLAATGRAPAP
ncbi:MAG TPA: proline dehydrogenase family protein [Methanomicrobiales archaeon]|nr:proline dehydrogenase family protein [Methanomicrobiales archaeon]